MSEYVMVPREPSEAQWGGLARDVVMWVQCNTRHTGRSLLTHLKNCGEDIPDWLKEEANHSLEHSLAKGSIAAIIYKAMLAAAPTPPGAESLDDLMRRVAEALSAAVSAIYFDDSSDYLRALWSVVRAIDPAMADLLDRSPHQAYDAVNRTTSAPRESAPAVGDAAKRALFSKDLYGVLMDVQNGIDSPALMGMANAAIRLIDNARAELENNPPAPPVDAELQRDAELEALVRQWRHNAQGCGRKDQHAAGTWRSCARDLSAAIQARRQQENGNG